MTQERPQGRQQGRSQGGSWERRRTPSTQSTSSTPNTSSTPSSQSAPNPQSTQSSQEAAEPTAPTRPDRLRRLGVLGPFTVFYLQGEGPDEKFIMIGAHRDVLKSFSWRKSQKNFTYFYVPLWRLTAINNRLATILQAENSPQTAPSTRPSDARSSEAPTQPSTADKEEDTPF